MSPSSSRRQFLRSVPPAALAAFSGCTSMLRDMEPQPSRFELRPEDDLTLTLIATRPDDGESVYDHSQSFTTGEVLVVDEETLQDPPYDLVLSMDGEAIWTYEISYCTDLVVSVDSTGTVEIVDHTAC